MTCDFAQSSMTKTIQYTGLTKLPYSKSTAVTTLTLSLSSSGTRRDQLTYQRYRPEHDRSRHRRTGSAQLPHPHPPRRTHLTTCLDFLGLPWPGALASASASASVRLRLTLRLARESRVATGLACGPFGSRAGDSLAIAIAAAASVAQCSDCQGVVFGGRLARGIGGAISPRLRGFSLTEHGRAETARWEAEGSGGRMSIGCGEVR